MAEKRPFWGTLRELFLDVRAVLAVTVVSAASLLFVGAKGYADLDSRIETKAKAAVTEETARNARRIDDNAAAIKRLTVQIEDVQENQKEQKAETRAMREDLRLMARGRPLPPLQKDGGR